MVYYIAILCQPIFIFVLPSSTVLIFLSFFFIHFVIHIIFVCDPNVCNVISSYEIIGRTNRQWKYSLVGVYISSSRQLKKRTIIVIEKVKELPLLRLRNISFMRPTNNEHIYLYFFIIFFFRQCRFFSPFHMLSVTDIIEEGVSS